MSATPATDRQFPQHLRLQVYVLRPRKESAKDFRQTNGTVDRTRSVENSVIDGRESMRQSMTMLPLREDGVAEGYEVVRKFVHLTHPLISIALLRDEIAERYRRIYGQPLDIASVKDDSNCDFDMEYLASYVFSNGSVVNVITSISDDREPAALEFPKDGNLETEPTQHDGPFSPQNAGDMGAQTWLSNAAAEMTETAKRSLSLLRAEEPDDRSNLNRIETPSHSSGRERSPSLTPNDSSSYIRPGSSARMTKRRRQVHDPSPEIPESVIEESQAAYVPTQVDEVDMPNYRGDEESYTASDFGRKLVARSRRRRRRRSSGLSDIQLNPRLSLPPVISSDADVDVDPQKHPSSGHATGSSSPVVPLFAKPIINNNNNNNNNNNGLTSSVPIPSVDATDTFPAADADIPRKDGTDMATEIPGEEDTVMEAQSSKETRSLPPTNGGLEVGTPPADTSSVGKIIRQLKDAKGELVKADARKESKKIQAGPARKRRNVRKSSVAEDQITDQTQTNELATAPVPVAPAAPVSVAVELVDHVSTAAPEQRAVVKEIGADLTAVNDADESSKPGIAGLEPPGPDIAQVDNNRTTAYGTFDEEVLKRARIKLAQGSQLAGEEKPVKRRGRKPGSKNKPKVQQPAAPEDAGRNAGADMDMANMTLANDALPLPPSPVQGDRSKATGGEVRKRRITKLRLPRAKSLTLSPTVLRATDEVK
ncbi:hypothetical protein V1509DRAFT_642393 [Lipomyces kononenkoae]